MQLVTIQPTFQRPTGETALDGQGLVAAHGGARLPKWLKRNLPSGGGLQFTSRLIEDLKLETVCESAKCPNRLECWSQKTATFMILGNVCTRPCGFCSVPKGKTEALELDEPERVAEAAERLGLKHVVITSVTRDDLADGGAEHFYRCVLAVRERTGGSGGGTNAGFFGQAGGDRARGRGGAGGLQSQYRDGAAIVSDGARAEERIRLDTGTSAAREAVESGD